LDGLLTDCRKSAQVSGRAGCRPTGYNRSSTGSDIVKAGRADSVVAGAAPSLVKLGLHQPAVRGLARLIGATDQTVFNSTSIPKPSSGQLVL